MQTALCAPYAYEGGFATPPLFQNLETRYPLASALAGPGAPVSGGEGTLQGRFGWFNPATGAVLNVRSTPQDQIGIVIPLRSLNGVNGGVVGGPAGIAGPQASWTWQFFDCEAGAFRIRPGLVVTLAARGNFWMRFAGGGVPSQPVYATLDGFGNAVSGAASNCELTPWVIASVGAPGNLAIVSTTTSFRS